MTDWRRYRQCSYYAGCSAREHEGGLARVLERGDVLEAADYAVQARGAWALCAWLALCWLLGDAKSPGQAAYETLAGGSPTFPWHTLDDHARAVWNKAALAAVARAKEG